MTPLSIMIKPASDACNLQCQYCFYHDVTSHREQAHFPMMSETTAERLIDSALQFADGGSIAFAFQGGEPLLVGLPYFSHFTEYVAQKNTKGSPIYYSIQTNGLLINPEWATFLREHSFLVGLSLDGNKAANQYRTDAEGKNSFDRILAAARVLEEYRVDFNILTVVTGYVADHIDQVYAFFKQQGFRYLQFIPCLQPLETPPCVLDTSCALEATTDICTDSSLSMTNDQYTYFLIHAFNAYVKDYVRGQYTSVRQFDNWVRLYLGQQPEQCGVCGHCMHQFVVEGNGNVYPCDFYCLDEWLLGNICTEELSTMAASPKAIAFIRESLPIDPQCQICHYYPLCRGGGCKRSRADRNYCQVYRDFFSACLPLFRVFRAEPPRAT